LPLAEAATGQHTADTKDERPCPHRIRKRGPSDRAVAELHHRPHSHRNRLSQSCEKRLSVYLHGKTRLPQDGFSWNL